MTVEIRVSAGAIAVLSEADASLGVHRWTRQKGGRGIVYAYRWASQSPRKKKSYLHRAVMERVLDRALLSKEHIDHINGDGLDNRRCNLRVVTRSENLRNRHRSSGTSSEPGVSWDTARKRWVARCQVGDCYKFLGRYSLHDDAVKVVQAAKKMEERRS